MTAATETLATRICLSISWRAAAPPLARDNGVGLGYNREPIHAAQALSIQPHTFIGPRSRCRARWGGGDAGACEHDHNRYRHSRRSHKEIQDAVQEMRLA